MSTPRRYTPAHAWSPVGYQIVQTEEETTPAPSAGDRRQSENSQGGPWRKDRRRYADVGERPINIRRRERRREGSERGRRNNAQMVWVFVPLGILALFVSMGIILNAQSPRIVPGHALMVEDDAFRQVVVPEIEQDNDKPAANKQVAIKEKPQAGDAAPKAVKIAQVANAAPDNPIVPLPAKCAVAAQGKEGFGDDQFGTSVRFVRNLRDAESTAKKQHKLVFVMHVSGNFEDARFT